MKWLLARPYTMLAIGVVVALFLEMRYKTFSTIVARARGFLPMQNPAIAPKPAAAPVAGVKR